MAEQSELVSKLNYSYAKLGFCRHERATTFLLNYIFLIFDLYIVSGLKKQTQQLRKNSKIFGIGSCQPDASLTIFPTSAKWSKILLQRKQILHNKIHKHPDAGGEVAAGGP